MLKASAPPPVASSAMALAPMSRSQRERLRHPLEKRVGRLVAGIDVILVAIVAALLLFGAEWLEARPRFAKYASHANIPLMAVLAAPIVATYAKQRRRMLAQEESIRIDAAQLPEIHDVLVRHCQRLGVALPELYLSDGVEHTLSFHWRGHDSIILSTHDFELCPDAFDDVVDFALARELGAICLGHTSFRSELLKSFVAPFPFLSGPLRTVKTYSCDRYGALLAPRAIRAVLVAATGDRLRNRVNLNAYLIQLDQHAEATLWTSMIRLISKRVPLAHRVRELRRAGLLALC
jgi:hypothetical protein